MVMICSHCFFTAIILRVARTLHSPRPTQRVPHPSMVFHRAPRGSATAASAALGCSSSRLRAGNSHLALPLVTKQGYQPLLTCPAAPRPRPPARACSRPAAGPALLPRTPRARRASPPRPRCCPALAALPAAAPGALWGASSTLRGSSGAPWARPFGCGGIRWPPVVGMKTAISQARNAAASARDARCAFSASRCQVIHKARCAGAAARSTALDASVGVSAASLCTECSSSIANGSSMRAPV